MPSGGSWAVIPALLAHRVTGGLWHCLAQEMKLLYKQTQSSFSGLAEELHCQFLGVQRSSLISIRQSIAAALSAGSSPPGSQRAAVSLELAALMIAIFMVLWAGAELLGSQSSEICRWKLSPVTRTSSSRNPQLVIQHFSPDVTVFYIQLHETCKAYLLTGNSVTVLLGYSCHPSLSFVG